MARATTAPEKRRFFYGWVIVAVALDAFFVHTMLMTIGFTVFLKPMAESLDTSRSAIAGAVALGGIAAAAGAPLVGRFVDRFGPRPVMVFSALAAGTALAALATVNSLWQLYLYYGIGVGLARPGLCFLSATTAIANWFVRRRGRAYAIAATGLPLAAMLLIPLAQFIISNWGWRAAWLATAGLVWAMLVFPPALLLRNRPEDVGQWPDGDRPEETSTPLSDSTSEDAESRTSDWTAQEALRSTTFWLVMSTLAFIVLGMGSVTTHMVPYFTDQGVSDAVAASAVMAWGFASLVAKAFWGYVAERYGVRRALQLLTLTLATSIVVTIPASTIWAIFLAAISLGWGSGGMTQLFSQVWPDYFGRSAQGTIRGWSHLLMEPFGAGGPLLAAWIFDVRGSYHLAFWLFAACLLLGTVMMHLAPRPEPRSLNRPERKSGALREVDPAD